MEEKIDSSDLATELLPLLDDYFNGNFQNNTNGILMKMNNGQIFQLTITEVE